MACCSNRCRYERPNRLVQFELRIGSDRFGISPGQYVAFEQLSQRLSGLGAFYVQERTLTGEGLPERVRVGRMTASFLPVLGVAPCWVGPYHSRSGPPLRTTVVICSAIGPGYAALTPTPGCSVER